MHRWEKNAPRSREHRETPYATVKFYHRGSRTRSYVSLHCITPNHTNFQRICSVPREGSRACPRTLDEIASGSFPRTLFRRRSKRSCLVSRRGEYISSYNGEGGDRIDGVPCLLLRVNLELHFTSVLPYETKMWDSICKYRGDKPWLAHFIWIIYYLCKKWFKYEEELCEMLMISVFEIIFEYWNNRQFIKIMQEFKF